MRPGRNRNKKQNAQPIFSVLLQMSHPLGSHLLHSQTVLAQKLLLMGGAEGIDVSQFSVRYEYLLLARPAKARR